MLTIQEIVNKVQSISSSFKVERDEDLLKQLSEVVEQASNSIFERHFLSKLKSEEWPSAADPMIICKQNSEEDKTIRASAIFSLLLAARLADGNGPKKFLDFGCGEGHVVDQVAKSNLANYVCGYDLENYWGDRFSGLNLTSDIDKIKENAPYDLVLMYDVLDHVKNNEQVNTLKLVKDLLSVNGKLVIRLHPWCGRHGTHMWDLNKAFAHVVFTEEELEKIGYKGIYTVKVTNPSITYKQWIEAAGFKITFEKVT